jgi:hypothetical protein
MFDGKKAIWMSAAGHCPEFGENNCSGSVGIDPNNNVQITCERPGGCAAKLTNTVVAATVEQVD